MLNCAPLHNEVSAITNVFAGVTDIFALYFSCVL